MLCHKLHQIFLQKWQRLTRLQKSIVYLLAVSVIILLVYKTTSHDSIPNPTPHPRKPIVKSKATEGSNERVDEDDKAQEENVSENLVDKCCSVYPRLTPSPFNRIE